MSTTLQSPVTLDARSVRKPAADSADAPSFPRWVKPGMIVLIVAAAAMGAWYSLGGVLPAKAGVNPIDYTVVKRSFPVIEEVKGELKAAQTTDIKCKVEGRSTIIWLIDEGATVKEGDLLVRLASDEIDEKIVREETNEASAIASLEAAEKDLEILVDQNASDIRKADLALEQAQTALKKYVEGDAEKEKMDLELEVTRANSQKIRGELDFKAADKLFDQGFITESEYLEDKFKLEENERAIQKADLSLKVFDDYTYPMEVRNKESEVNESKKELERVKKSALAKEAQKRADVEAKRANLLNTQNQLRKYREQKEFTEIRAPTPGLVVFDTGNRWDPRKIEEGAEIHERQTIVTLPDPSVMVVSVRIHEAKTNKVKIGQPVRVEVEGVPDTTFTGKITKIAPLADSRQFWLNPDLKEYETEITLDQASPDLKPSATARAEILIDQVDDALAVPVQAVHSKAGHHFVFRADGNGGEPVEVQLGASSSDYVEIADGLADGDTVLLAVSEDARRKLPNLQPPEGETFGQSPEQTAQAGDDAKKKVGKRPPGDRSSGSSRPKRRSRPSS